MDKTADNCELRISPHSEAVLRELARREGKPIEAILDDVIEHYQRDKFMDEVNAAYAALRNDAQAWAEELAERRTWDAVHVDPAKE